MKKIIGTVIFIIYALQLTGQVNADSIFNSAILNAKAGEYDKALDETAIVLEMLPDRYDVMVFNANVKAWKGDYAAALIDIDKAYLLNETNNELYDSWLNILLWSEDYPKLIETADLAKLNDYTNSYNIVLKKAQAYKGLTAYNEGINFIDNNETYLDSTDIKKLYDEMQMSNRTKAVSFYYSIDLIDQNDIDPQHLSYIDYTYKKNQHTIIPRFSYANRYDTNDFQLEVDYYHSFKNKHYFYSNYGLGIKEELFPLHKGGFEYYFPLPQLFEASMGGRYFYSNSNNTLILTGHIGKSFNKLWLAYRPFYVFNDTKNVLTSIITAKYSGENPINYWGLELAYGNSPDERDLIIESAEIFTLKNYRVKVEKNTAIFKYSEIKLAASYSYEEYPVDKYRNRLRLELLLKHKF